MRPQIMLSSASAAFGEALSSAVGGAGPRPTSQQREHLSKALETIEAESLRYKQHGKPWVNENGEVIWPWPRIWIACIVRNQTFETLMGVVILANVALIVYETNADAACYPEFLGDLASCPHASGKIFWTFVSNVVLQVIYTAECAARGYVERAGFFRNRWNLLDLFIVIIGWLGMGLTELVNLNVLRIFRAIMMTISLGVMNLILAVIVEKATQSRQNDLEAKVRQKELERERNMIELALLCDRMDLDASGTLSMEEMILGYEQDRKMHAVMTDCGLEKSDMQILFNVMDADGSGEVDYVEFCSELGKIYKRDPLVMASMTRHSQAELKKIIQQEVMTALRQQTEMMHDHLDLLSKIPGLESAGAKVKQKWQANSRASKRQMKLSSKLSGLSRDSLAGQVSEPSFTKLEAEIARLLAFSERLQPPEPVLDRSDAPSAKRLPESESKGLQDIPPLDQLRLRPGSSDSLGGITPSRRQQWTHLDRKLQDLCQRFQTQMAHEELMQQRCQDMINSLTETVQENLMVRQQM